MFENRPCSNCEAIEPVELVKREESLVMKGKTITYLAEFYRCSACGTEFEDMDQLDRNLDSAREAYDLLYATPSPAQLRALREKYGASQKAFGLLMGFGEATMHNYEKGDRTPEPANRLLLNLASDPWIFKKVYDLNKDKIGQIQRRRIEPVLEALLRPQRNIRIWPASNVDLVWSAKYSESSSIERWQKTLVSPKEPRAPKELVG